MFDLNAIVSAALNAAVQQAVAPLVERIDALEKNEEYLTRRIAALEGVDHERQHAMTARWFGGAREEIDALATRIATLETQAAAAEAQLMAARDRIAALETKLTEANLFTQTSNATITIDEARMVEALNSQEWFWEKLQNRIDSTVEAGIDDHTSTYDHDDYDSHVSDDDKHFDGDIEDAVRDALSNMTFDVSIR